MTAFRTQLDSSGVAFIIFDLPGESVNKIGRATGEEFSDVLERLLADSAVKAMVLISGKPDTFIAGADIEQVAQVKTAQEAEALSRWGQALADRIERSPKPIVAAIHGVCVGGGCELALAAHWRVATDHPKTQIGLPEVQLGLIPGIGGCNRLPRLLGVRAALDIILAGKSERAAKAKKIGLVDELVHPAILDQVAIAAAQRLMAQGKPRRDNGTGTMGFLLDRNPLGRQLVYRQARQTVLAKTGGNYPAPLAALEVVRTGLERGMAEGLALEARRFGELAVTDVSRKLVQIFFATNALKKDDGAGVPVGDLPPVKRLGIVGSGFMGAGIAGTAVLNAGVEVRLRDAGLDRVGKGLKAATSILDERLKRRRLTRPEHQRLTALLSGTAGYEGFDRADVVIEAVFEDVGVKRGVIADLENTLPDTAVVASNTSTIPISELAVGARHPHRLLGMHFFSPVEKMPLLEVIPHDGTAPEAIAMATRFGRAMGKTVIVVGDKPGFWVNRILSPYINEAGLLLEEGVPIEVIDRAMTHFGFPVGPITLLDEVGFDVAQKAGAVMYQAFGERFAPSSVLAKVTASGRLGRKNGRGFYQYVDGKKTDVDEKVYDVIGVRPLAQVDAREVERRLVYAMLNEAARAVADDVVRTARDGDIGAIFGIGFPPFRGGPLRMLDDIGATQAVAILRDLQRDYGPRFAPAPLLEEMAGSGEKFYE